MFEVVKELKVISPPTLLKPRILGESSIGIYVGTTYVKCQHYRQLYVSARQTLKELSVNVKLKYEAILLNKWQLYVSTFANLSYI